MNILGNRTELENEENQYPSFRHSDSNRRRLCSPLVGACAKRSCRQRGVVISSPSCAKLTDLVGPSVCYSSTRKRQPSATQLSLSRGTERFRLIGQKGVLSLFLHSLASAGRTGLPEFFLPMEKSIIPFFAACRQSPERKFLMCPNVVILTWRTRGPRPCRVPASRRRKRELACAERQQFRYVQFGHGRILRFLDHDDPSWVISPTTK
jgi:hypothetical protein